HLGEHVGVAEIDRRRPHLTPVPRPQIARQIFERVCPARDQDEVQPPRRELRRERRPQPLRRSRDERPRPVLFDESCIHVRSTSLREGLQAPGYRLRLQTYAPKGFSFLYIRAMTTIGRRSHGALSA